MNVIFSPFSTRLKNGKPNPKVPPLDYWKRVVELVGDANFTQVAVNGDPQLVPDFRCNLPLKQIMALVEQAPTWLTVDTYLQHLVAPIKKPGVVLFSKSDPNIFGYPHNVNLLKGRQYLRRDQFGLWIEDVYDEAAFVDPPVVANAVKELIWKRS